LSSETLRNDRSIVLDATRTEQERVNALMRLRDVGYDSATLLAAVDLASRSSSMVTRRNILRTLRQTSYDAVLAQPFTNALLTDADAAVRAEAALGLNAYLDIGGSRVALEQAARNDSSPDVRLAAQMALMDYDQQQAFERGTLLDRTLSPEERLAPMSLSGSLILAPFSRASSAAESAEETLAYAEIVDGTDDTSLQFRALTAMRGTMLIRGNSDSGGAQLDPEIVRVLIESGSSPDSQVRRAALGAMQERADVPEIRTVLESVVENEPALAEELGIPGALARRPRSGD
jgi:hypothetical protein